jgi:hypothetical protein
MRMFFALALSAVVGCANSTGNSGDMGGGGSGGGGGGGAGGGGGTWTGGPFTVQIGPYDVAGGSETTNCVTVRMPITTDVDVTQIDTNLTLGGHHLILYRSTATTESTTPSPCGSLSGITQGDVPLVISQNASSSLALPTGVAYHFTAGQMVRLEMHFLNAQQMTVPVTGVVTFTPGASGGTYQKADIMFIGTVQQLVSPGVPANTASYPLNPKFFAGDATIDFTKIKVFGLTTHQHWTGKSATIWKSTSATVTGTELYTNTQWDNAPLATFDDAHLISFAAGEGLRWNCVYDTLDAVPKPTSNVTFCESARSCEMCFLWAYYFPSAGSFVKNWQ